MINIPSFFFFFILMKNASKLPPLQCCCFQHTFTLVSPTATATEMTDHHRILVFVLAGTMFCFRETLQYLHCIAHFQSSMRKLTNPRTRLHLAETFSKALELFKQSRPDLQSPIKVKQHFKVSCACEMIPFWLQFVSSLSPLNPDYKKTHLH